MAEGIVTTLLLVLACVVVEAVVDAVKGFASARRDKRRNARNG